MFRTKNSDGGRKRKKERLVVVVLSGRAKKGTEEIFLESGGNFCKIYSDSPLICYS